MGFREYSIKVVKMALPRGLRSLLKGIMKKVTFLYKYGFLPPPMYSDLSGYEVILDFLKKYEIHKVEGDIVEIGAFLGGGTYKLSKFYKKYAFNKNIFTIDIFDPQFDDIECTNGIKMKDLYEQHLTRLGKKQIEIFTSVTKGCHNLTVLIGDSKSVTLPCSKVSFAYIDGNHTSDYVLSDFYKIWGKLSTGGVIAFDDYGDDLPNVTQTIQSIIGREYKVIRRIYTCGTKTIFIQKGQD